jgi:hypothetical protein
MASSATPALRTSARIPRSLSGNLGTGHRLVVGSALALVPIIVRSVMARADGDIDTTATRTDHLVRQQRIVLRPQTAVDPRRTERFPAARTVSLQTAGKAVRHQIRPLTASAQARWGGLLGDRQADVAELVTVVGAATNMVRSRTGSLRRAVRVLQGQSEGRWDQRTRLTTRDDVGDTPRALDTALGGAGKGDGGATHQVDSHEATKVTEVVVQFPDRQTPAVLALVGGSGTRGAGAHGARAADLRTGTAASSLTAGPVAATGYAAARSRAHGPTTALWHAVELHRPVGAVDGACELTVCGSLVRLDTGQRWPVADRGVCPACATLAR